MDDVFNVQEVQGEEQLLNDDFSLWLCKSALIFHGFEEGTSILIVKYQVDKIVILEYLVQREHSITIFKGPMDTNFRD